MENHTGVVRAGTNGIHSPLQGDAPSAAKSGKTQNALSMQEDAKRGVRTLTGMTGWMKSFKP